MFKRLWYGVTGCAAGVVIGLVDLLVGGSQSVGYVLWELPLHGALGAGFGLVLRRMQADKRRLLMSHSTSLNALANAVAAKDDETNGHCQRVVQYSLLIGREIGLSKRLLQQLQWGALLHDIGKIAIPDAILKKPGALTDEEWDVMKEHPYIGYLMVKDIEWLHEGRAVVFHHHERFDGTGYPQQLQEHEIPLLARLFAIVDTFDAITSDRPYRKGQSIEHARAEIQRMSGQQFCPECVEAFARIPVADLQDIQEESKILEYEAMQLQKLKHIS